jgi:hypothetical protein
MLRGSRGASQLGTIAGFVVFLAFMLLAVQVLLGLFHRSIVTSAAHEAARVVASRDVDQRDAAAVATARARGERRARQLLGRSGDDLELDWSDSDTDTVVLHVWATSPRVLLPGLQTQLGFDHVDRTVRVRVETLR